MRTTTRQSDAAKPLRKARVWDNPWWEKAACKDVDTDIFFGDGVWEGGDFPTAAARICHDCPVYVTCRLAGYGEHHGVFANSRPSNRKTTRMRIFNRLFPHETTRDDDLLSLRRVINALIEEGTDVLATMRRRGFNQQEIDLLLKPTTLDERATEVARKQANVTTKDKMFRNLSNGSIYAN